MKIQSEHSQLVDALRTTSAFYRSMDFDDEAFADNFDEDLLRAVEQQESQYFGVAGPSVVHNFATTTHSNAGISRFVVLLYSECINTELQY